MISFSPPENIADLKKRLKAINPAFENFEVNYITCHKPESIPAERI